MHENCAGTVEKRVWKDHRVRLRCRKCGWMCLYHDADVEPHESRLEPSPDAAVDALLEGLSERPRGGSARGEHRAPAGG
jgi:hypothetical protein